MPLNKAMLMRRIGYLLWLFAAALLYVFENSAATLALLAVSAVVPAVSILLAFIAAGRLSAELSLPAEFVKGDTVSAALLIRGRGIALVSGQLLCRNTLTGESAAIDAALMPFPGAERSAALQIHAAHCGCLLITCEKLWVQDLFGLWRPFSIGCADKTAVVRPRLFMPEISIMETATAASEGERYSMSRSGSDPSETFAIREYAPGDPIRQIHWKLSQKTGTMMMRELGLPVEDRTLLLFDLTRPDSADGAELIDAAAEVFLSLSRAMISEGLPHTVGWQGADGAPEVFEICSEQDFAESEARFLSLIPDGSTPITECFRIWCGQNVYAHTAVAAAAVPPDIDTLVNANRVTVLCGAAASSDTVNILTFSAGSYEQELAVIEL